MVEQDWPGVLNYTIINRTTWRSCWDCGKKIEKGNKYHKWRLSIGRNLAQESCTRCFEVNMKKMLTDMQSLVALMTSEHWLRDDMNRRRKEFLEAQNEN